MSWVFLICPPHSVPWEMLLLGCITSLVLPILRLGPGHEKGRSAFALCFLSSKLSMGRAAIFSLRPHSCWVASFPPIRLSPSPTKKVNWVEKACLGEWGSGPGKGRRLIRGASTVRMVNIGLRPLENNVVEQASALSRLRGEEAGVPPSDLGVLRLLATCLSSWLPRLPTPCQLCLHLPTLFSSPLGEPSLSRPDSQTCHACPDYSIWITRRI